MEEFEKTIAQLNLQLLDAEHRRHQQVRVRSLSLHTDNREVVYFLGEVFIHLYFLLGSGADVSAGEGSAADQPGEEGSTLVILEKLFCGSFLCLILLSRIK